MLKNCFFCSLLNVEVCIDNHNPINTGIKYSCLGKYDTDILPEEDGTLERSKIRECCSPSFQVGFEYDRELMNLEKEKAFEVFKEKYIQKT